MTRRTTLVLLLSLALAGSAAAERNVTVNGQRMDPNQVAFLDAAACTPIPNGRYWLAPDGTWGYEGIPYPMGVIGDQCYAQGTPRRKSLSERGLLYSPGEILSR